MIHLCVWKKITLNSLLGKCYAESPIHTNYAINELKFSWIWACSYPFGWPPISIALKCEAPVGSCGTKSLTPRGPSVDDQVRWGPRDCLGVPRIQCTVSVSTRRSLFIEYEFDGKQQYVKLFLLIICQQQERGKQKWFVSFQLMGRRIMQQTWSVQWEVRFCSPDFLFVSSQCQSLKQLRTGR